jgi:hypothetical protein
MGKYVLFNLLYNVCSIQQTGKAICHCLLAGDCPLVGEYELIVTMDIEEVSHG